MWIGEEDEKETKQTKSRVLAFRVTAVHDRRTYIYSNTRTSDSIQIFFSLFLCDFRVFVRLFRFDVVGSRLAYILFALLRCGVLEHCCGNV